LLADGVVRPNWREWTDADWFAFTMQTAGEDA
jgi:hypothetical protein